MSDTHKHYAFVFMGVSGSGKSVVAGGLAEKLNAAFLDGDYLHPKSNILKMASGEALNDADRLPWLKALNQAIFAMQRTNPISLVVCSALKKQYRDLLRDDNENLYFLYLKGDAEIIGTRLSARKGHFFKPEMLTSQLQTLEEPDNDEADVFAIDIHPDLDQVIAHAEQLIRKLIRGAEV